MIPPVIICRQYLPGTADDLAQGHKLGYACAVCKRQLQATNTGARQIAAGAWPLCNQCGFDFIQKLGVENLAGIIYSPEAREWIARKLKEMKAEL